MIRIRTIDAHAAGEPLRLIVDGFPLPRGRTMLDKREWVRKRADHLRRAAMLEPRGHADMYGAVLTEPVSPGSDAGVLFMHNEGYSTMCGHGIIAVTTIALERSLLMPADPRTVSSGPPATRGEGALEASETHATTVVYDTPAGTVRACAVARARDAREGTGGVRHHGGDRAGVGGVAVGGGSAPVEAPGAIRVERVAFTNVPSFVLHGGLTLTVGTRRIRADVAFGGAFYAIVDAESIGLPIDLSHLPELRRMGMEIKHAIETNQVAPTLSHPIDAGLHGLYGTIFTGPPHTPDADLRNVTIFADAEVDRSPCGTGTAAVMAVLEAMGLLSENRPFVHESIIGTRFTGRLASRTTVGELQAIVPEISGSAWITGEHTFLIEDDDPLREGFRL
jgi:proline racemase